MEAMPSTGLRSEASIASENSLPKVPKSEVMTARMPANSTNPTTLIQISAQMRVSILRIVSKKRRLKKCMTRLATTFLAASRLSGKARRLAPNVPRKAIAKVSPNAET